MSAVALMWASHPAHADATISSTPIPGMPAKSRADPIGRSDHAGGITGNKLYRIRRSADDRSTGSLP
jgi:hypothetical protein